MMVGFEEPLTEPLLGAPPPPPVGDEHSAASSSIPAPSAVPANRGVLFRGESLLRTVCESQRTLYEPNSPTREPKKGALKPYRQESLNIDVDALQGEGSEEEASFRYGFDKDFLADFGFTEVMAQRVVSKCSRTYQLKVLLDNGPWMKKTDSKFVVATKRTTLDKEEKVADSRRMALNDGYTLRLMPCPRYEALKDVSYFLVHLAAILEVPAKFQLIHCPKKFGGCMKGYRTIGTTHGANAGDGGYKKPEDYISLANQGASAMEMLDEIGSMLATSKNGCLDLLEQTRKEFEEESETIATLGKNVLVVVVTSLLPWGNREEEGMDHEKFLELLNSFANLPVTVIFFVEATRTDVLDFYDNLLAPSSPVQTDIRVVRGLGSAVEGTSLHNPWLNYCLPLHLCRALGIGGDALSAAAWRPLTGAEVREVVETFGGDVGGLDPDENPGGFADAAGRIAGGEEHKKWNPARGYETPLIDEDALRAHLYRGRGCCSRCFGCFRK